MKGYKTVKIPSLLADLIDGLVENGEYSSRTEFVKEVIRRELRERGLLGGES
jgi:Arc/MetJ-type ribon-helix-helix transcriptional regulator